MPYRLLRTFRGAVSSFVLASALAAFAMVLSTPAHASCVGMAMSADGASGYVWRRRSCENARRAAIRACESRTRMRCTANLSYWDGWAVGIHCVRPGRQDSAIGTAYNLDQAISNAYRHARRMNYYNHECRIIRRVGSEIGPS